VSIRRSHPFFSVFLQSLWFPSFFKRCHNSLDNRPFGVFFGSGQFSRPPSSFLGLVWTFPISPNLISTWGVLCLRLVVGSFPFKDIIPLVLKFHTTVRIVFRFFFFFFFILVIIWKSSFFSRSRIFTLFSLFSDLFFRSDLPFGNRSLPFCVRFF